MFVVVVVVVVVVVEIVKIVVVVSSRCPQAMGPVSACKAFEVLRPAKPAVGPVQAATKI